MSSDFLNSPSISVTFPFTSNSVHRSFNSLPALPVLLRPIFAPLKSSKKLGSAGKSLLFRPVFSLGSFSFHNLLSKGRLSVEPCRLVAVSLAWDTSFCLCALATVKGYTGAFFVLGLRKSRLSRDDSTVAWCRGVVVNDLVVVEGTCGLDGFVLLPRGWELWQVAAREGVKKPTCSDCACRKRRTGREGVDTGSAGDGLISLIKDEMRPQYSRYSTLYKVLISRENICQEDGNLRGALPSFRIG